jgi:hypothetical protein
MTLRQTIDIPANREVTIHLVAPETVPCGKTDIILEFPQEREADQGAVAAQSTPDVFDEAARLLGYKDDLDYLRANSPKTIEEAEAEAERKFKTRKSIYEHYGCLKGEDFYGDGMEYQRKMRDEWRHRP